MKKFIASATCAFVALASVSTFIDSSKLPGLGVDIVAAASEPWPGDTKAPVKTPVKTTSPVDYKAGTAPEKLPRVVRYGSEGHDVRIVQGLLLEQGYKLAVDGSFGKATLSVVKTFQKNSGLKVDGLVGPLTYAKLRGTAPVQVVARTIKYGFRGADVKLVQEYLNSLGYKLVVDSSYGPKTQAAVKDFQKKNGLKVDGNVSGTTFNALKNNAVTVVKVGKAEYAAHGTKCYTVATVAMAGDRIAAVYLDDYQFMGLVSKVDDVEFKITGVPNSDKDFGTAGYKDATKALASKRLNAAYYSANMKKSGGATLTVDQNFQAVEAFAVGKTIDELEKIAAANEGVKPDVDAVAGATLADTTGYLKAIVAGAKAAAANKGSEVVNSKLSTLKLGKAEYAAHGTKCFTVAIAAVVDGKIVSTYFDDYQFMGLTSKVGTQEFKITGVPNSDKDFGANYKDATKVLASKKLNQDYYSANMKASGGATLTVAQNFGAVEAFALGKTASEIEDVVKANTGVKPDVDAVAGATLADTNGYLSAIAAAAKAAK